MAARDDGDPCRFRPWLPPPSGLGSKRALRRRWMRTQLSSIPKLGVRPQGPQLQKVLERLTGQHTVPNVFIGGKHIGGCTDTVKLYRTGELETLLSEASAKNTQS
nr:glutaredoxin-C5, chloroplastic isoform X2 [Malus domestica]